MKFPTSAEFVAMTPDEFASFWEAFDKLEMLKTAPFNGRWFVGRHDIRDLLTLKRAGWKPEPLTQLSQPMSWYWRRPARRKTGEGMLFKSTSMALSELRREEAKRSQKVQSFAIQLIIDGKPFVGSLPAKGVLNAERLADNIGATLMNR